MRFFSGGIRNGVFVASSIIATSAGFVEFSTLSASVGVYADDGPRYPRLNRTRVVSTMCCSSSMFLERRVAASGLYLS